MRYGNRRVDLYLSQGGFGHWALRTVRSLCLAVIQGEWKRLPMMLCGKKIRFSPFRHISDRCVRG